MINIDNTNSSRTLNTALVEKARDGDRSAMGGLVDLYQNDIFRMVFYRTRSKMDAEDLTQEIFVQMVKSLPSLKDTACFRAWLFKIAVNRIRDFYRKKRILAFFGSNTETEELNPEAQSKDNPAETIISKEFVSRLSGFTQKLTRFEREVFLLRFVDHLGIREITDVLNKNESTIKTHLYRAIAKFKNNTDFRNILTGEET